VLARSPIQLELTVARLPGNQDQFVDAVLKANPRTTIVYISGTPIEMPWIDQASTVVQGWFMGSELGNAVGDVLFGRVSPSGKLTVTFPRRLEHNPS
jgi:beta-glucosidase